jgi:pyridoxamine 5'-phosphate oxidase-like protein
MATRQGDVALLQDPVAQKLLNAPIPGQLAYTWLDGTPRVLPIGFHWDGRQIVFGTPPDAPKMKALARQPKVALTINSYEYPFKVLLVRGTVSIEHADAVIPEYVSMAKRLLGDQGAQGWLANVEALLPAMGGMARLALTPEWVGILDFEQRFPSALEEAMAKMQPAAP